MLSAYPRFVLVWRDVMAMTSPEARLATPWVPDFLCSLPILALSSLGEPLGALFFFY